jgi:hypothetical protein
MRATAVKIAVVGLLVIGVGCTATPIREATPTPSASSQGQPDALAFTDDADTASEAGAATAQDSAQSNSRATTAQAASRLLETVEAGAWVQITDSARIGVHSAPDSLYTRVGLIEPGAGVLGTGRGVSTADADWMEINWGDATGWVLATAFARPG